MDAGVVFVWQSKKIALEFRVLEPFGIYRIDTYWKFEFIYWNRIVIAVIWRVWLRIRVAGVNLFFLGKKNICCKIPDKSSPDRDKLLNSPHLLLDPRQIDAKHLR